MSLFVLNYKKPTVWILIAAAAVFVILAVCFLTNPTREYQIRINNSYNYSTNIMTVKEIIKDDKDIAKKEEKIEDVTVSEIKKDDLSSKKDTNSTSNKTPAEPHNFFKAALSL